MTLKHQSKILLKCWINVKMRLLSELSSRSPKSSLRSLSDWFLLVVVDLSFNERLTDEPLRMTLRMSLEKVLRIILVLVLVYLSIVNMTNNNGSNSLVEGKRVCHPDLPCV